MRSLGVAVVLPLLSMPAQAVTWNIDFGSVETTFEAPAVGGPVTSLVVTLGGVTFDTPAAGDLAPVYSPASNDFRGAGGDKFSYYVNAPSGSGCPEALCLLEFEDRFDPITPPVWAASPPGGEVFASGYYEISPAPIPLPAPLALLAAALGALVLVGLGRRSTRPNRAHAVG